MIQTDRRHFTTVSLGHNMWAIWYHLNRKHEDNAYVKGKYQSIKKNHSQWRENKVKNKVSSFCDKLSYT